MFMIPTIQSTVSGAPTHIGSAWMPSTGNVKRSIQTLKNATGITAAASWPPSFCHQLEAAEVVDRADGGRDGGADQQPAHRAASGRGTRAPGRRSR